MSSPMRPLVDQVAQAVQAQNVRRFRATLKRLVRAARGAASPDELTLLIGDLVPLLSEANGVVTELAVLAGACVEWGGSPLPLSEVLPSRAVFALAGYRAFPEVWRTVSGGQPLPEGRSNVDVVGSVADYAKRNGRNVDAYRAIANSWFDVTDWIKPMITCLAERDFRGAVPAETRKEVRDAAAAVAATRAGEQSGDSAGNGPDDVALRAHWLEGLAMVLDDEPLIVLDPVSRRGFRLTMSGIGDNYQLHTLLADRLSGADGVPGLEPPRRDWVDEATEAPLVNHVGTDPIVRRFRLYDGTGGYVDPEGRPADIGVTDGMRVLVIHPPNGMYGWANARAYEHMKPTLTLDAALGTADAADWLDRIAPANETDMMSANRGKR
jgi:hypothetical protein